MMTILMAGGKGSRMAQFNAELPKPMLPLNGKPILEYQIECLKKQGITDIIIVVGYKKDKIREYFGDGSGVSPVTGNPFGITIRYIEEKEPLGTAGALYFLQDGPKEDILLINGDLVFDIEVSRFAEFHREKRAAATLMVHPNSHPYDSAVIEAQEDGRVMEWRHKEEKREWYKNLVNAGIHMLSPEIFEMARKELGIFKSLQKVDLDRDIFRPLVRTGRIYAYHSPEYIHDAGVPERFAAIGRDLAEGRVEAKCLSHLQKAIFLDRDGTVNQYVGYLTDPAQFELLEGAAEAIRLINESGYLAIVVTNQPVIARGDVSVTMLERIHNKMETLLGMQGAYLDDILYCPHHPDGGFEGEVAALKTECSCRKPKPGMLVAAAEKYHIDLSRSWMVGDSLNDMLAGRAAGCRTAGVGGCRDGEENFPDLLQCIRSILGGRQPE